jgi:ribosomal protein S18 acetylase RimI-like enzyme
MKDHSLEIRRATLDDAGAIAAVHVASWRTTYPGIVSQSYIDSLSVDERTSMWTRRLSEASNAAPDVLVVESPDAGIVGFASGGPIRHPEPGFDAELYAIYLLAEFQGRGVGRRLVVEWARLAVAGGLHAAIVRVLADNPACAFYERLAAYRLRESRLEIGGKDYPEICYAWSDLRVL